MAGKVQQAPGLLIKLDPNSKIPIQRQLTDRFKELIISLHLMPGQLIPSTRELATAIGVSRATVVRVYSDLVAQGYIETIEGRGTFVRRRLKGTPRDFTRTVDQTTYGTILSESARQLMKLRTDRLTPHDFPELNYGCSPPQYLPLAHWIKALSDSYRKWSNDSIDYGTEPFGFLPLRKAVVEYLSRDRMIECPVENLVLCTSSTFLLHLLTELLIDPADVVAFPEPGPMYPRETFLQAGAKLLPIPLDENGLHVQAITELSVPPKLVYLNPSHHDPTGACLSIERRKALLAWAEMSPVVIIEDDYEAEYRYSNARLPSLRAMAPASKVIYLSSFWKTLYPLVNLTCLVCPEALVPVLRQSWQLTQHGFHTHFGLLDQMAMTELLAQGLYEKHIHKSQSILARQLRLCILELTRCFGKSIKLADESCFYHLFIHFLQDIDSEHILKAAAQAGLCLFPAGPYFGFQDPGSTYLFPFAYVEEKELSARISAFKTYLNDS